MGNPSEKERTGQNALPEDTQRRNGMLTLLGLVRIEVAIGNQFASLACLNRHNTDNRLE
jgi:hypothetical protein